MRAQVVLVVLAACESASPTSKPRPRDAAPRAIDARVADAEPAGLLPHHAAKDLAAAWTELVGDDVRAVGIGELHTRIDKATRAPSAIARFTSDIVPLVATRASDLVVETWVADPDDKKCGAKAKQATAKVDATIQRPEATKDEVSTMVDALRAAGIQPHAMRMTCADYALVAPPGKDVDLAAMLTITTRELGRVAIAAVAARTEEKSPRTLVLTYGGALHNDLYPVPGVEDWAFGPALDRAVGGHYVELELIVPEYAELDTSVQHEAWYPLLPLASPDHVVIIEKAPRAYAVLLTRTP